MAKSDGFLCTTCSEEFTEKWILEAHYLGHEKALKMCMEIQRLKVGKLGLNLIMFTEKCKKSLDEKKIYKKDSITISVFPSLISVNFDF